MPHDNAFETSSRRITLPDYMKDLSGNIRERANDENRLR